MKAIQTDPKIGEMMTVATMTENSTLVKLAKQADELLEQGRSAKAKADESAAAIYDEMAALVRNGSVMEDSLDESSAPKTSQNRAAKKTPVPKRGRSKDTSKSQAIRDYDEANPDASAKDVVAALAKQGIEIKDMAVYNVRSQDKAKVGKKTVKKKAGKKKAPAKKNSVKEIPENLSLRGAIWHVLDREDWPMLKLKGGAKGADWKLNIQQIETVIKHDKLWSTNKKTGMRAQISNTLHTLQKDGKVGRDKGFYFIVSDAELKGPKLDEDGKPRE